ncbi:MAG: hypothetical protein LBF51_00305 [Zoogloeaceae bacterium]|nr:hypothetical protein [Zoogloeaceae bacterium]
MPGDEYAADFFISGKDRAGKPWTVHMGQVYNVAGWARIFTADLDGNGIGDIVVWMPNAGNGMAPTGIIHIVTFEKNGRPIIFGDAGFYGADEKGVEYLLDINRDGRAELLAMRFGYGYWISDLYQVKNARWRRVSGKFGRLRYPALTRFTHRRPNRTVVRRIMPERKRDVENEMKNDMSNDKPLNNAQYVLADGSGKRFKKLRGSAILEVVETPFMIDDESEGRMINADANFEQWFTERRVFLLYGLDNRYRGLSNPHTIWALPSRKHGPE